MRTLRFQVLVKRKRRIYILKFGHFRIRYKDTG